MTKLVKHTFKSLSLAQLGSKDWQKLHYEFFKNFPSKHTRKCYQRDIEQFVAFIAKIDQLKIYELGDVERIHIVAFRNYLDVDGMYSQFQARGRLLNQALPPIMTKAMKAMKAILG